MLKKNQLRHTVVDILLEYTIFTRKINLTKKYSIFVKMTTGCRIETEKHIKEYLFNINERGCLFRHPRFIISSTT